MRSKAGKSEVGITMNINNMAQLRNNISPFLVSSLILLSELQPNLDATYLQIGFYSIVCLSLLNLMAFVINVSRPGILIKGLPPILKTLHIDNSQKIPLVAFILVYFMPLSRPMLRNLIVVVVCATLCWLIYVKYIIRNIHEMKIYFSIFFVLGCMHLFYFCFTIADRDCPSFVKITIALAIGQGVTTIITKKLKKFVKQGSSSIKNPKQFDVYMQLLFLQLRSKEDMVGYLLTHQQSCNNLDCSCNQIILKNSELSQYSNLKALGIKILNIQITAFARNFSAKLKTETDFLHCYSTLLIQAQQKPQLIKVITKIGETTSSYFTKCLLQKIRQIVFQLDNKVNNVLINKRFRISFVENYDKQTTYVNKEIQQILRSKVVFFRQLCLHRPRLQQLESIGRYLVDRIEALHAYYLVNVRPLEQRAGQFFCSFIYISYLLLTSNATDYAISLYKKTKKRQINRQMGLDSHLQFGLMLRTEPSHSRGLGENPYLINLDHISSSLCALLGRDRQSLVGTPLASLIPSQLAAPHHRIISRYLQGGNWMENLIHIEKVPLLLAPSRIILMRLKVLPTYDLRRSRLIFFCNFAKDHGNRFSFIADAQGRLRYSENHLRTEVLSEQQVNRAVIQMAEQARTASKSETIERKTFSLDNYYQIQCSKLMSSEASQNHETLIRFSIAYSENKQEKTSGHFSEEAKTKQIDHVLKRFDETDSQSSTSSHSQSVSEVITNLMQLNSFKLDYRSTFVLALLLAVFIGAFLIAMLKFHIWDTSVSETTPAYTVVAFARLRNLVNSMLSWYLDIVKSMELPQPYLSYVNEIYNSTITEAAARQLPFLIERNKNIINNYLIGSSNELYPYIREFFGREIDVGGDEQMSIQSIVINFIADSINIIDLPQRETLLKCCYLSRAYHQLDSVTHFLYDEVVRLVDIQRENNLVFVCLGILALLVFVAPLRGIFFNNKRKIITIYNILCSLEGASLAQQMRKNQTIEKQIFLKWFQLNDGQQGSEKLVAFSYKSQSVGRIKGPLHQNYSDPDLVNEEGWVPKLRQKHAELEIGSSKYRNTAISLYEAPVLLYLVAFIGLVSIIVAHKYPLFDEAEQNFRLTFYQFDNLENMSIAMLNAKIYMDSYSNDNRVTFGERDLDAWIDNWILTYNDSLTYQLSEDTEIKDCEGPVWLCRYSYSDKVFAGMAKAAIVSGYQQKRRWLQGERSQDLTQQMQLSRVGLFAAESWLGQIREKRRVVIMELFHQLELYQATNFELNSVFYGVFGCLCVLFAVWTGVYLTHTKANYIKQLSLLTTLSKEMTFQNKSIECFLKAVTLAIK